ncbi:MAG: hypothetical protein H6Q00_1056 [Holophagaceae bacterium]|nr:hypothetical protein [Holophagaceae bacterium]
MITPLGQRQIFQTANVEAVRMSLEVSEQIQREAARRKAAEDHLAEEQDSVHGIGKAEGLRTEERKGRGGQETPSEEDEEAGESSSESPESSPAQALEGRLDFLA